MTMPAPDDDGRDVAPLGGDVARAGDDESQGGCAGGAGPSYPPVDTEPDARWGHVRAASGNVHPPTRFRRHLPRRCGPGEPEATAQPVDGALTGTRTGGAAHSAA